MENSLKHFFFLFWIFRYRILSKSKDKKNIINSKVYYIAIKNPFTGESSASAVTSSAVSSVTSVENFELYSLIFLIISQNKLTVSIFVRWQNY